MSQAIPRGLRINNPLNIRKSNNNWRGKVTPSSDPDFEEFETIQLGIRAAFRIIRTYLSPKYKCEIIRDVILRFAPAKENNVQMYTAAVIKFSGIKPFERLRFSYRAQMSHLLQAMARVEVGQLLPYSLFEEAYDMV